MKVDYYFSTIALLLGATIMEAGSDPLPGLKFNLGNSGITVKLGGSSKKADKRAGTTTAESGDNWGNLEKRFPYDIAVLDNFHSRDLKPGVVLYVDMGKWDIKEVTESSTKNKREFTRYTNKILDDVNKKAGNWASRFMRHSSDTSKFYIIVNLEHFKREKQGCFQCERMLREIVETVAHDWDDYVEGVFLVKATNLPGNVNGWITEFEKESKIPVRIQREGVTVRNTQGGRINKIDTWVNNRIHTATFSMINERDLNRN